MTADSRARVPGDQGDLHWAPARHQCPDAVEGEGSRVCWGFVTCDWCNDNVAHIHHIQLHRAPVAGCAYCKPQLRLVTTEPDNAEDRR